MICYHFNLIKNKITVIYALPCKFYMFSAAPMLLEVAAAR